MITVLAFGAMAYGLVGALSLLIQRRRVVRGRSARELSLTALSITTGGYLIWLAYGIASRDLVLITVDAVGLATGSSTLVTAVHFRLGDPGARPRTPQSASPQATAALKSTE